MASKSKKRRRVFRASCILAALIIAGSSFAWFTSKDEVTNRLTANADYGVSIVESFTPPKNWLPGQEINKDVYAVNTGNIDAFVKEDVAAVLNYTYEDVEINFPATGAVELTLDQVRAIEGQTTEDGFKTNEAGGFLAWTSAGALAASDSYSVDGVAATVTDEGGPFEVNSTDYTYKVTVGSDVYYANSTDDNTVLVDSSGADSGKKLTKTTIAAVDAPTTGSINSGRTQDIDTPWTPTTAGVYVFRRSINKASDANAEPFTYSGYYYDGNGKYYKIVLGSDKYPAASRTEVTDPDTGEVRVDFVYDISANASDIVGAANVRDDAFIDQETGEIKTDVGYMFVVEKKATDQDIILTLDAAKDRLVAEYTVAYNGNGTYDANATLARAQVDYENAKGAYDAAKASYDNAVANHAYGLALAKAEQALYDAKVELESKYKAVNGDSTDAGAKADWEAARDAVFNGAKYTDDASVIRPTGFEDNGVRARATDDGTALDDLHDGIAALKPVSVNNGGIMPDEVMQATTGTPSGNPYVAALADTNSDFYKAFTNYVNTYKAIYGNDYDGDGGLYKEVTTALATVKNNSDATTVTDTGSAAAAKTASATLKTKAAELESKMKDLQKAYADFVDATEQVTGMNTNGTNTPASQALTSLVSIVGDFSDNADKIDELVDTYVQEEKDYVDAKDALATATEDWKAAVDKYQTDVEAAKSSYNGDTNSAKKDITDANAWDNNNDRHVFEDKSDPIVANYSAVSTTDPKIQGSKTADNTDLYKVYNYDGSGAAYTAWPAAVSVKDLDTNNDDSVDDNLIAADFAVKDFVNVDTDGRAGVTDTKTEAEWLEAINDVDGYKDKLAAAKNAYDAAKQSASNGKTLKFYINLDENWEDYWTMDPDTDKTTNVDFYLNKVLEAGETSHKLIDSVEFDSEVAAGAYKELTFDLNVGLDSIQVTYDENQRGYTTDAVKADPNFAGMSAAITTANANGNNVTWTDNAGVPAPTAP